MWPGVQAIVTSMSLPNIFRFSLHVNTVLGFTMLFWIARIAAWLSTKIIVFSIRILSMIIFFANSAIAKTSAGKTLGLLYLPRFVRFYCTRFSLC